MDYYSHHRTKLTLNRPRKRGRFILPGLLCILGLILALNVSGNITQPRLDKAEPLTAPSVEVAATTATTEPPPPVPEVEEGVIQPGQTASNILDGLLSPAEIHDLSLVCREIYPLERLKAGNIYRLATWEETGEFCNLEYEIDGEEKLVISRTDQGLDAERIAIHYEVETRMVQGSITTSLFGSVSSTGESDELAIRLAEIFAWDVDFVRDLRIGDAFACLVEKRYRDDEFANYGRILAARFTNNGKTFQAYLYEDGEGRGQYFDEKGQSVRKAFLKAPLSFRRISSGYSKSRLHPILKVRRPHQGIDYAAPTGTPIKTVGDGTVIGKGYTKAAGRYLKIRHNSVYETVYNHMSRYASGMNTGVRVSQGQVIGYVGSTGYSTGPHLDFRMKKNGQYVNPLTIDSPSCEPVPAVEMDRYMELIRPLQARLDEAGVLHAETSTADPTIIR